MSKADLKLNPVSPGQQRIVAILLSLSGFFSLIALVDYNPEYLHSSPTLNSSPVLGKTGLFLARSFYGWFGISSWLLPLFFINLSIHFFRKTPSRQRILQIFSSFGCIVSICVLANVRDFSSLLSGDSSLFQNSLFEHGAGGSLGAIFYSGMPFAESISDEFLSPGIMRVWLGNVGTVILSLIGFVLSLYFQLRAYFNLQNPFERLIYSASNILMRKKSEKGNEQPKDFEISNPNFEEDQQKNSKKWKFNIFGSKDEDDLLFEDVSLQKKQGEISSHNIEKTLKSTSKKNKKENKDILEESATQKEDPKTGNEAKPLVKVSENIDVNEPVSNSEEKDSSENNDVEMDGFKVVRAAKTEKAGDLFPERKGDYHFPTLDLLMEPPEEESNEDEDHMIKARNLKETLAQFKVEIELGEVHTGPVITRYDVHPAAGVRVEKIANLDKNLAMALKADSVRILAPVPGKGCVGIEVPNQKPAPVCLKEILQSKAWADAGAEIPIVLGKEASGKALVADLTKMPHLLVAGSTGSGKTVCINAIIASLCYYSSPEDVRFIMVDPKIVEMKVYNDLPHMLIPVVTEPKKVPGALKWLLVEMERRYQIFSKVGVRNIAGFNAKILKDKEEKEKAQLLDAEMTAEERAALSSIEVPRDDDVLEIPENKLPYIVCIIDELADLMMVAQADVETGIARLAQLARAAGIHLIIATQRPSVNVITGVIKANLPSRISFRVASYRDSQTILDGKGAEALIGKGDMLFIPPGSSTFLRAQGAFVSDDEINGIVDYLKINGPPQIIEEVREQIESAGEDDVLGGSGEDSDEDPMVRKAIEIIRSTKRASTSNLQRKLSIGYNRAARIMDDLEDRGLVGPDVPGQGREILMDL